MAVRQRQRERTLSNVHTNARKAYMYACDLSLRVGFVLSIASRIRLVGTCQQKC
jgi:hypothetical protein